MPRGDAALVASIQTLDELGMLAKLKVGETAAAHIMSYICARVRRRGSTIVDITPGGGVARWKCGQRSDAPPDCAPACSCISVRSRRQQLPVQFPYSLIPFSFSCRSVIVCMTSIPLQELETLEYTLQVEEEKQRKSGVLLSMYSEPE